MPQTKRTKWALTFHPLRPDRWGDFETLFGERGACGGCWCMAWRLKRSVFQQNKGTANKAAMKMLVQADEAPGILAYSGKQPIGWIAVARREQYTILERSRVLKPVDDAPVWSVSCFFIAKGFRKQGVSVRLLKSAADFVRRQGGAILEGYPVQPKMETMPDVFAWTGLPSAFLKAGFVECDRRSPTRPIMRKQLNRVSFPT